MKKYLVGGAIRDGLLKLPIHDKDYVVVGSSIDEMLALGFTQVGKDFPVFLHPETKEEYALARKERKIKSGHDGFICDFSPDVTLIEDLYRRDLTINAIAWDSDTDTLIDPFDGASDLKNGVLRHVSEHFREDPVRLLRIARINAKFPHFKINYTTHEVLQNIVYSGELNYLTSERVWSETKKAIMQNQPIKYFEVLNDLNCFELIYKVPFDKVNSAVHNFISNNNLLNLEERLITMGLFLTGDEQNALYDNVRAEFNIRHCCLQFSRIYNMILQENDYNYNFLKYIKLIDGFRIPKNVYMLVNILSCNPNELSQVYIDHLIPVFDMINKIGFDDLSHEQREKLKDKDIGNAITKLREEKIKEYSNGI